ncbi:MAG: SDR family oxidoreductase [Flavobacteriaceae bacterium]|nr:SDR family oxidoreductase [Muriicola sp.]NNC61083.1 SDR family oxidoreductase [Eudoraea sp.]NNK20914.1 SDR family oxidoreductase [Flavobacteriaceae bacterium]MBT8291157.1 SDR family oxidoreductase [Muriicola sp.]NNK36356.1 SDR family oxidoreductase [Eudoraea sp.]
MIVNLKGKNALVGGSSRGIGLGIARQLAKSGARVTIMARREEKLRSILASLHNSAPEQQHQYLVVDFNNYDQYKGIMEEYFATNTVDILINNTQGPQAGSAAEKEIGDYQEAFDTMFKTVVFTTQLALTHMKARSWGRIINVASVSVKEPLSYLVLSNTIRSAVVAWAKSLASEVGPYQITVNNVLTGYFDTERLNELNQKKAEQQQIELSEVKDFMTGNVPLKRLGKPEEYGYLATFLASDQAAYITGTNIPIDGGLLKSL